MPSQGVVELEWSGFIESYLPFYTKYSSFISKGTDEKQGAQIDLLIDRKDHVINVCEMKFLEHPFVLSKSEATNIRHKLAVFKNESRSKKALFPTIISSFGILPNEHSIGLIQQVVQLDDLFKKA